MTPVEIAAAAFRDSTACGASVEVGPDHQRENVFCDDPRLPADLRFEVCDCRKGARAALLALAEVEIQDAVAGQGWSDFMARDEERIDPSPSKDMKAAFRAMIRALAKEEGI